MERGLDVRPPRPGRARGAPAGPRDRARHPAAPAVHRGGPDPHAGGRVPGALPGAPRHGGGHRPRRGGRLPGPHGALLHQPRRDAGTSTTPSRWRCWSGPSCWPASGERPVRQPQPAPPPPVLPPPRQGGLGAVRATATDPSAPTAWSQAPVGWQCPECTSEGAKRSRHVPAFTHTSRGRTGVVGSTNPTPDRARHHRHQRGGVPPRGLRHQHERHQPLRPCGPTGCTSCTSTTGPSPPCGCTPASSTSSST